jgi:hypothetical protein
VFIFEPCPLRAQHKEHAKPQKKKKTGTTDAAVQPDADEDGALAVPLLEGKDMQDAWAKTICKNWLSRNREVCWLADLHVLFRRGRRVCWLASLHVLCIMYAGMLHVHGGNSAQWVLCTFTVSVLLQVQQGTVGKPATDKGVLLPDYDLYESGEVADYVTLEWLKEQRAVWGVYEMQQTRAYWVSGSSSDNGQTEAIRNGKKLLDDTLHGLYDEAEEADENAMVWIFGC